MIKLRLMTENDIAFVLAIQCECYVAEAIESETTIRTRLSIAPSCAWIAEDADGACAYLVGYPSELGKVTPLGSSFSIPPSPTSLYLHDLAVSRRVAGQGVGSMLVRFALDSAQRMGLHHSSLVSVQNSVTFWRALGYREQALSDTAQAAHLNTYPAPACYMVRVTDNQTERRAATDIASRSRIA
ncbi:MAG TPA: GNAT family N-acetyltransferase [Noviherbaspirillum sp.]|nr:GNAT family N-acetyltransferase [Noviherbaspirillum sp.]